MNATLEPPTTRALPEAIPHNSAVQDEPSRKRHSALVKGAVSFFCFALALWQGDYWIGKTLENHYFQQQGGADRNTTVSLLESTADIEIFGDSRGCHHYNSRVIEAALENKVTTHNASRTAQTVLYADAVQKAILERHHPRIVILDLNPVVTMSVANATERLSVLRPYYNRVPAIRSAVEANSSHEKLKLLSQCYRYNSKLPTLIKHSLRPQATPYVGGHHPLSGKLSEEAFAILPDGPDPETLKEQIDPAMEQALIRFVSRANAANIRVILIASPIFQTSFEPTAEALALKALEGLKFEYWDYLQDPQFYGQKEKFYDRTHLNGDAAREFSALIGRRLKSLLTRPTLAQARLSTTHMSASY